METLTLVPQAQNCVIKRNQRRTDLRRNHFSSPDKESKLDEWTDANLEHVYLSFLCALKKYSHTCRHCMPIYQSCSKNKMPSIWFFPSFLQFDWNHQCLQLEKLETMCHLHLLLVKLPIFFLLFQAKLSTNPKNSTLQAQMIGTDHLRKVKYRYLFSFVPWQNFHQMIWSVCAGLIRTVLLTVFGVSAVILNLLAAVSQSLNTCALEFSWNVELSLALVQVQKLLYWTKDESPNILTDKFSFAKKDRSLHQGHTHDVWRFGPTKKSAKWTCCAIICTNYPSFTPVPPSKHQSGLTVFACVASAVREKELHW